MSTSFTRNDDEQGRTRGGQRRSLTLAESTRRIKGQPRLDLVFVLGLARIPRIEDRDVEARTSVFRRGKRRRRRRLFFPPSRPFRVCGCEAEGRGRGEAKGGSAGLRGLKDIGRRGDRRSWPSWGGGGGRQVGTAVSCAHVRTPSTYTYIYHIHTHTYTVAVLV